MSIKTNYKFLTLKIFSHDWKYGFIFLNISILLCFSIICIYNLSIGQIMSADSFWYSNSADDLIKSNFDLLNFYSNDPHIVKSFFYTLPVILIAIIKLFFGIDWQNVFIYFNLCLVFLSLLLFSKSLLLLKVRPLIISLGIYCLTLSADLLTWPRYVLTDILFSFLILTIVYTIIKGIIKKKTYYFNLTLLFLLLFFTRPTSIVILFFLIIYFFLINIKMTYSPRLILLIIFKLFLIIPFILSILYFVLKAYFSDIEMAIFIINFTKSGIVIHDRPETLIQISESFFEILYLYFIKMIFFFTPYVEGYSIIHAFLNIFQISALIFSLYIWAVFGKTKNFINLVILMILLMSCFFAGFHALTIIDYDFRYRYPIIMPLAMILPISLEIILKNYYLKVLKSLNFKI